jgi:hypothetical protein
MGSWSAAHIPCPRLVWIIAFPLKSGYFGAFLSSPAALCRSVVNLRLQEPESALVPLRKLHTLLPDQPEVVHCIALAHDMLGDTQVCVFGGGRWAAGAGHNSPVGFYFSMRHDGLFFKAP